jgi:hypothetical protein
MAIGLNLRGDARVCAAWGVVTGEPTVPEAHRQREALLNALLPSRKLSRNTAGYKDESFFMPVVTLPK